jgi:thymidylate synthase
MMHEELQYIQLIRDILERGTVDENNKTKYVFGVPMRFSLKDGQIPLLTTKKLAWKTCFRELQFFIRGQTDSRILEREGSYIWSLNSSREYLDARGLTDYPEGTLGPVYGYQWRSFGKEFHSAGKEYHSAAGNQEGIDQLDQIIRALKDPIQRNSRRLIMSAWNPMQLEQMVLPPCHVMAQFHVREGKYLSCAMYQRSGDVGLGVPFNIASYSFLTHILAKHCDLEAEEFVYFLGNAHLYTDHISAISQQMVRDPFPFPKIQLRNKHERIEEYELDDIVFDTPYVCHGPIRMNMIA